MTKTKQRIYVNRFTGDLKYLTPSQAKTLSEDWTKTEQIKNSKGERGIRLQLNGATVDILETKEVVEVEPDVDKDTK